MTDELNLPQVFQHWQPAPVAQAGAELSFGAAPAEQVSRWRLDLPAGPGQADAYLAQAEAQLQATQALLEATPLRLDALVTRVTSGGEAHYAVEALPADGTAEQPAEAALLSWIDAYQPGQVAFGGVGLDQRQMGEAVTQFQQVVNNLLGQVLHLAQVETSLEGQLLARSLVSWTGDVDTTWGDGTQAEERSLHQRSLALALASRLAMLKMFTTVTQGAAKIAVLIAAPGGALLALPAAWKYLQQLLAITAETQSSPRI
jgi:hypothetical protein